MATSRISRIGSNSSETNSVTIPAGHQAGDLIIISAFRDGSATNPTIPAGWTNITNTSDGTTCSISAGWKFAASGAETSGTWTNATGMLVHVYRGVDPVAPLGTFTFNGGSSATLTYGATTGLTKARMDNQWFVAFAHHRSINTTTMTNAPTGYTLVVTALGATQDQVSFDTDGPTEIGFASNTVATGGTSSGFCTIQLPIYPPMMKTNNFQQVRSVSAGVISVGEKVR